MKDWENHYECIAKAIRFLDEHRYEQPGPDEVAAAVGLSSLHFHRVLSAWAGITSKDFLQSLTLSHGRDLLKAGEALLSAARDTALQEEGRLHESRVTLEIATPGEIKARGAGMCITAGVAASPFGKCLVGETSRGICHLSFFDSDQDAALAELQGDWPLADIVSNPVRAQELVEHIFSPAPAASAWKLYVRGTPFQLRVWRALLDITPGTLVSYGKLAAHAGNPHASRATGTAVGANAISYLIPCHRVIRETGIPGNYRWGAVRKRAILAWESAVHAKH